jgi:hypothetical protein
VEQVVSAVVEAEAVLVLVEQVALEHYLFTGKI